MKIEGGKVKAIFKQRLNLFAAVVELGGRDEVVHLPSTGRMGQLFAAGRPVFLTPRSTWGRKTKYDLVLVELGRTLVCVDATVATKLVHQALLDGALPRFSHYQQIQLTVAR